MKVNLDVVPSTLDQAVDMLVDSLNATDREFVRTHKSVDVHHTIGQAIRNSWSLWDTSTPLPTWFRRNLGLGHADDISGIILERLWCRVLGTEHDLQSQVDRFKLHWTRLGCDPASP